MASRQVKSVRKVWRWEDPGVHTTGAGGGGLACPEKALNFHALAHRRKYSVTLAELLSLSGPWFYHLKIGKKNNTHVMGSCAD